MTHTAIYVLNTLTSGQHAHFLGLTGYQPLPAAPSNVLDEAQAVEAAILSHARVPARKPRSNPNDSDHDPLLSIVAEGSHCTYVFRLAGGNFVTFDQQPLTPIGSFGTSHITNISRLNDRTASFELDANAVKNSPIGRIIAGSGEHDRAIRVPFVINLIDNDLGDIPAGLVDDHRYAYDYSYLTSVEEHEHQHGEGNDYGHGKPKKWRRHGGVHPSSLSNFIVVELP